jgi:hypothetical protein
LATTSSNSEAKKNNNQQTSSSTSLISQLGQYNKMCFNSNTNNKNNNSKLIQQQNNKSKTGGKMRINTNNFKNNCECPNCKELQRTGKYFCILMFLFVCFCIILSGKKVEKINVFWKTFFKFSF